MISGSLIFLLGLSIQINPIGNNPAAIEAIVAQAPEGSQLSLHRLVKGASGEPVFARLKNEGGNLRLTPTFLLSVDEPYEIRLISKSGNVLTSKKYQFRNTNTFPPKVRGVLPGCRIVPANLLKFYIEFDQPMREGKSVFDFFAILDEQEKAVKSPWRRQELWSNNAKRLTLWIHPGRIKQGVNLREELGPVLEPEKKYTLVISKKIRSQNGISPIKDFRLEFETAEEYRRIIHPEEWKIKLPPAGSKGFLMIETVRALDPHLFRRHVDILNSEGRKIPVQMSWDGNQKIFRLTPGQRWGSGDYLIKISGYLEDLAGNTPLRAFDTDLEAKEDAPAILELKFTL